MILFMPSLVVARELPDDIEQGTSVNNISLPLTEITAAELAHVETGGRVLSVHFEYFEEEPIFRVKVLHDNGMVKTYRIHRDNGQRM
ncbi:hypothetical protein Q7C_35 [Methylophaga frappieri]|uniref:PepSY domain-containing protein n=1 Tax=Methylophaga frappieri (strain ATCC BAA-2434 / DSM 25690 / JAM7) TaxID=754477 RepID=I1YE77_METFJ|nr:hypothetical protein Q7C_35 [Methylophaga frappieri]